MTKYIEEHSFTFDHVFDENCRNEEVIKFLMIDIRRNS